MKRETHRLAQKIARRRRRRRVVWALGAAVIVAAIGVFALYGRVARGGAPAGPGRDLRRKTLSMNPRFDRAHVAPQGRSADLAAIRRTARRMAYVSHGGRRGREIALTFDDGPGPYTLGVLRVLRHTRTPATFLQIGFMIPDFPRTEAALVSDHDVVLGDHTETHPTLTRLSAGQQYRQIDDAAGTQALHHVPWPHLFRPPYGAFDRVTLEAARRLHMLTVLWSVDSEDYRRPGVHAIVSRVLDDARPGSIVLLHDAGGNRAETIQALPIIIRELSARHFRLVTVPRLLRDAPPDGAQSLAQGACLSGSVSDACRPPGDTSAKPGTRLRIGR